ncbi:hypothetical protein D3C71_1088670 [compost metagenome]
MAKHFPPRHLDLVIVRAMLFPADPQPAYSVRRGSKPAPHPLPVAIESQAHGRTLSIQSLQISTVAGFWGGHLPALDRELNQTCIIASSTAYSPRADFQISEGSRALSPSMASCTLG